MRVCQNKHTLLICKKMFLVEVDNSTDIEVSTDFQRADHFHQLCRLFGIGLVGFIRKVELAVGVERVLQLLFQLSP